VVAGWDFSCLPAAWCNTAVVPPFTVRFTPIAGVDCLSLFPPWLACAVACLSSTSSLA